MIPEKIYLMAKRIVAKYEEQLNKSLVNGSSSQPEYKVGDELELDMGNSTIEKVSVVKITPHPEVKGSVYYEFSNGAVCRDLRLH
mgnify:FL=1